MGESDFKYHRTRAPQQSVTKKGKKAAEVNLVFILTAELHPQDHWVKYYTVFELFLDFWPFVLLHIV